MTSETDARSPLALVTGASTGIGYELSIQFAKAGFDLIIVAENDAIHDAQVALEKMGHAVTAIQTDLASRQGVEEVAQAVAEGGTPLSALALNAGIGASGRFVGGAPFETDLKLINLNILSTVHLAKLLLPKMVENGEGRLLITSAIASLAPGPFHAVYHASKAFIQSFAEAIREELKDSGVTVTALMPGATDTPFFAHADMLKTKVGQGKKDNPAEVAKQGFEAMMRGDGNIVAGSLMNKVQSVVSKIIPDAISAKQMRSENEPLKVGDEDSMDAIALLTSQHRDVKDLFERIEKAEGGGEGAAIFKTLASKLQEHMKIEEDIFYPAAAKIDQAQVIHAKEEHEGVKSVIQEILSTKNIDNHFLSLVQNLKYKIFEHIDDEEHKLFPACEKAMTKGNLIDLAEEMADLMVDLVNEDAQRPRRTANVDRQGSQEGVHPS